MKKQSGNLSDMSIDGPELGFDGPPDSLDKIKAEKDSKGKLQSEEAVKGPRQGSARPSNNVPMQVDRKPGAILHR